MASAEQSVPDWAIERARELHSGKGLTPILHTFAAYIAAHEKAPVDPLLIEAREIVAKFYDTDPKLNDSVLARKVRQGLFDGYGEVRQALSALRRGMELAKATQP